MFHVKALPVFFAGFSLSIISLSWVFLLLPLSWVGFPGYSGFFILFFLAMVVASGGGLSFLPFLLLNKIPKGYRNYYTSFAIFLLLVIVSELSKALMLWFIFYDSGFSFSLNWSIFSLGHFAAFKPFIVWAGPLHTYSLSVCFGYLCYLIFLIYKKQTKIFLVLASVFVLVTTLLYAIFPLRAMPPSSELKNITVLPEGVTLPLSQIKKISQNSSQENLLIDGGVEVIDETGTRYNVSNYYFSGEKEKVVYKEFLMPFGEYMPVLFKPIAKLYLNREGNKKDYDFWRYMRFGYIEGHNNGRSVMLRNTKVVTLLCSEVLSFSVLRKIKQEQPDIVYMQGSYLNFNDSALFFFFLDRWIAVAEQYMGVKIVLVAQGI